MRYILCLNWLILDLPSETDHGFPNLLQAGPFFNPCTTIQLVHHENGAGMCRKHKSSSLLGRVQWFIYLDFLGEVWIRANYSPRCLRNKVE